MNETPTGSVTDADELIVVAPAGDAFDALLEQGFDAESAAEIERTSVAAEDVIEAVQTTLDPSTLRQRVALSSMLIDDTPSMGIEVKVDSGDPESKVTIIYMALRAHDKALDVVEKVTANEPVDVLASASWMNANPSVAYAYTRIAEAPRFGSTAPYLTGMTAWYDRYAELLAATAKQMGDLEEHNKTVYGMCGLVTDGFDNDSRLHTWFSLAKVIRGFRRMKTFVPYVIYTGAMPEPGTYGYVESLGQTVDLYEYECSRVRRMLKSMGVDDVELVNANSTLEDLIRAMFISAGFDPTMVFLPGQDPRAIVKAFVTVSKLMASVSQGQMPQGLTAI